MRTKRKQRLILVCLAVAGVAVAVGFALMALQENINLFYSPTQVQAGEAPADHTIRLGGLVVAGTIRRSEQDLKVSFDVTDTAKSVTVEYEGILPDLFREGQGVVTTGKLRQDGVFHASQVLAKHDENYMPPEVSDAISQAFHQQRTQ